MNRIKTNLTKKTVVTAVVIVVAASLFLGLFLYMNPLGNYAGEIESISVAYSPFESLTLFWIAESQDFSVRTVSTLPYISMILEQVL